MPVRAEPTVPAVPEPSELPRRIAETTRLALASESVSLSSMISLEPSVTVIVPPSLTELVSFAATGASLTPLTVIAITALSNWLPINLPKGYWVRAR